jgi:hypothetical protein
MSQSNGSTWFSDAGLSGSGLPVVRGMLMAASGVVLTLSNSWGGTNTPPDKSLAAAGSNIRGFQTGSVVLSNSKQEFVMFLNGHKASDLSYPNLLTASFDPTAPNYFGSVMNKDPLRLEQAGYVLYNWWDLYPSVAVVTGAGTVISGASVNERIAFLITGSSARNSGSTTAPNFENFEDRYRTANSPWVISQQFGGKPQNLFKIHTLDDGAYSTGKIKISIENIAPSLSETYLYGKFDLIVRDFNDTDANPVIIEERRQLAEDIKKVASENAKLLKAATLKAAKDAETARLLNRTANEIAEEKRLSDIAKNDKKAAKELKKVTDAEESNNRRIRLSMPLL